MTRRRNVAAAAVVSAVFAQVTRLSGNAAAVAVATVSEADPLAPVVATAVFADQTVYSIPDVLSLVGSDPLVATAFNSLLSYLATK